MAIIFLQEIWAGVVASSDQTAVRRYKRLWLVRTNSMLSGPLEVTDDARFPKKFAYYKGLTKVTAGDEEYDYGATLRQYDVRRTDDPFTHVVEANYSSERNAARRVSEDPHKLEGAGQQKGDKSEQNPLLRPPEIRFGTEKYKKPVWQDAAGNAVVASNGERFDPPLEIDQSRLTITVVKNYAAYPVEKIQTYQDTVNDPDWTFSANLKFAKRTVKCNGINGDSVAEQGMFFWKVTFQFSVRYEGWNVKPLNVGTYTTDAQGAVHVILDPRTGTPVTTPVPLDAAGLPLSLVPPIAYTYGNFQPYAYQDFNQLLTLQ